MDILEKLKDLHTQATTERSHYYVAGCCNEAIAEIERLRAALHEIVLRTDPYNGQWSDWPLVAGIDDTARKALNKAAE